MDDDLAKIVGARVRFYRTAAHKSKTVVAGLCGVTPDYLYQIERGLKLPTVTVLARMAEVMGVPLASLLERSDAPNKRLHQPSPAGDPIYRALTSGPDAESACSPKTLRNRIVHAWRIWQTSPRRYSQLTSLMPSLIEATEATLRSGEVMDDTEQRRVAHACSADLYGLLRTVTKRTGQSDLSLLVADRAVRAAEVADEPLRMATAQWNLTQVLLADGQAEGAESLAMRSVAVLEPFHLRGDLDATALKGALLLLASVASARRGDGWAARDRLREVAPLAARTGERNAGWTAFGPTNLDMYAVNVEVETGEAVEGLRLARSVDYTSSFSIERRVAFLLDQAKGYQQRRDFERACTLLTTAEKEAPEDIRHRPAAHTILRNVIERGRRPVAMKAVRLAERVGLPV